MTKIEKLYGYFIKSSGVTTDSRQTGKGKIFFALKGEKFDGNRFAEDAVKKGAAVAVIDNCNYKKDDIHYFCVEDTLQALQVLAAYHISRLNTKIFAITGTNGKTTTKELVKTVLSAKFNVFGTEGNFNNHIGLPLTVLKLKNEHEIAVLEMGASKPGDIKELCEIANPAYGLITNIGKAHLEFFGSQENLIKTKMELYDYINLQNGTIFYNCTNNGVINIEKYKCNKITYGLDNNNCTYSAKPIIHSDFFAGIDTGSTIIKSNLAGYFNAENILSAYAVGKFFGISDELIKEKIETYTPENKRSQLIKKDSNLVLLDAYNANPTSMSKSLESFISYPTSLPKIAILGDMLELGKESYKEHLEILKTYSQAENLKIIAVGNHFLELKHRFPCVQFFKSTNELKSYLSNNKIENSFILLKGSRGMALENILSLL